MNMEIYKSKYVVRSYDEKTMILTSTWLETTQDMNENDFKEEMLTLTELIRKYRASFLLSVLNDLRFPIVPELQAWIVKNIGPKFNEAKLKKQAVIVPSDIIAQLSMEQTIDDVEKEIHIHQSKFFDDIQSAKIWLVK